MNEEDNFADANYGIVAFSVIDADNINILHMCLYWEKPTEISFQCLKEELNTDEAFNLVGRIGKDVFLMEATPDMISFYKEKIQ
jgi:hypothetical protein